MKAQLVRVSTAAVLVLGVAGVPAAMACGSGGGHGGHHSNGSRGGHHWRDGGVPVRIPAGGADFLSPAMTAVTARSGVDLSRQPADAALAGVARADVKCQGEQR